MNKYIGKLAQIASKQERKIIGLMSGTSLDGLDIALCQFQGTGIHTQVQLLHFQTISYEQAFKSSLKEVCFKRDADLQAVCLLNATVGLKHAEMVLQALGQWNISTVEIDLIASHGQTIFHAPQSWHQLAEQPNATLQIGDGDHIAFKTGIITLCDFRQKHIAAGGEGAPLAVYGDYILFSSPEKNRVLLNIGGIANLTFLPSNHDSSQVFSSDIGPGNTLLDQYIQKHYPYLSFDRDAQISKSGQVNQKLLKELLKDSFFALPFPKTTGPELFNLQYLMQAQSQSNTTQLQQEDIMATLVAFTAQGIIIALKRCLEKSGELEVYLSGGGVHHPLLMAQIKIEFPSLNFQTTETLGIPADAKEAVLFALLANECLTSQQPNNFGSQYKVPNISMGKICIP